MWLKRFGSSIFHFDLGLEPELTPGSDESLIAVAGINHSLTLQNARRSAASSVCFGDRYFQFSTAMDVHQSFTDVLPPVDGAVVSEISKGLMVLVGIGTGQHSYPLILQ